MENATGLLIALAWAGCATITAIVHRETEISLEGKDAPSDLGAVVPMMLLGPIGTAIVLMFHLSATTKD